MDFGGDAAGSCEYAMRQGRFIENPPHIMYGMPISEVIVHMYETIRYFAVVLLYILAKT